MCECDEEVVMADVHVVDWIEEYESLTESEIHTYASEQEHNQEVMIAIYVLLDDPSAVNNGPQLVGRVCKQLLSFYRSGEQALRKFAMQFIPILVALHLSNKNAYPAVKALLISLYNLEVVDSKGQPKVKSFRVPSIAQSSLFHDSSMLEPTLIAESTLRRWEECNSKLVSWGPLPQVESINAQNRQRVTTALMFLFNQQLTSISVNGLERICRTVSKLVSRGFFTCGGSRTSADSDSVQCIMQCRNIVSSPLLLELLHLVYHALERGVNGAGQTLAEVVHRARYEAYPDVLLMCNAVQNLLHRSPASSLAPRPSNKQGIAKSMITNASFRTKKLPDDIPIQEQDGEASLDSIVEEQEGPEGKVKFRGRSGSALKHLPKLPGLTKKPKSKNSPTPPRHSLDMDQQLEMKLASGDQVHLPGNYQEQSATDSSQTVHVSTV